MNRPDFDELLATASEPGDGPCLCQTHSPDLYAKQRRDVRDIGTSEWSFNQALERLSITQTFEPFPGSEREAEEEVDGQSWDRTIWISPVVIFPVRTAAHELAHVVLGHNELLPIYRIQPTAADRRVMRNQIEAEAESTAMLVTASLDVPDRVRCLKATRAYIASHRSTPLPKTSQERVKRAAAEILAAGALDIAKAA